MNKKVVAGLEGAHPNHGEKGVGRTDGDLGGRNATGTPGNAQGLDEDI